MRADVVHGRDFELHAEPGVAGERAALMRQRHTGLHTIRPFFSLPVVTIGLMQALAQASLPLVQLLKEEYAGALAADDSLSMLFEQVLSRHFQVTPRGNMGGYLSQMLEMFNGFGQTDD